MRSINTILEEIITAKDNEPGLNGLNSTSKVSVWRLWAYITAVAIWSLEQILELSIKQQSDFIRNVKIHSTTWYSSLAKKFQFGDALPWGETDYEEIDETKQVVKFAAVQAVTGGLLVKVAGETGGVMGPLGASEFTAFKEYMHRVKAAGDFISYRNEDADLVAVGLTVYYDALILDGDGKRLDGTNDTPVADAVEAYLESIDFNGSLVPQTMVDRLQEVEGVKIVDLQLLEIKISVGGTYVPVPASGAVPYSGYARIDVLTDNYIVG